MERERNEYSDTTEDSDINHINNAISSNEDSSESEYDAVTTNIEQEKDDIKGIVKEQETVKKKIVEKRAEKIAVAKPSEQKKVIKPQKKKEELKPKKHFVQKKVEKMEKKKFTIKKSEKKSGPTHKAKGTKLMWLWILIAIIVIAGIAFLIITLSKEKPVDKTTSEIAATVNGEPIYSQDIDDQYNNMNPILQQMYTKESILNQTIDELLLIQEAKNKNIKVSDAEIKEELANFKLQNGLTESDFETLLKNQNLTLKELEDLIERRLLIKDLLNETIFKNIEITDEAIKQYYEQNKDKFTLPEQATVQHILILINDNTTDSEAKDKIEEIEDELTATNFCELAKKYSEDPGSKDTCGTYTFGKGEMVQEFEEASFDLDINDTEIVKTIYGYHLIKKLAYNPEGAQELSEVEEDIKSFLNDEAAQTNFDKLLVDLRSKATIVNYMYKTNTTTVTTTTTVANLDAFAKCLTEKDVKMYGAYWCPHCENNKKAFGDSWQYVTYVECAVEGQPQVQTAACTVAGIEGYPTWIVDGEKYPGEQTLQNLAKLTGCTL